MKTKKLKIRISKERGSVSAKLLLPEAYQALLVLSHGAGAGMDHHFMEYLAKALGAEGIATLRFNFWYMENGPKPPDRPPLAQAAITAAVEKAKKLDLGVPIFIGGKSFGGRMTSLLAVEGSLDDLQGIIYFGFPLHAPGRTGTERAAHLKDIKLRQLFLQGTRDTLAKIDLIKAVTKALRKGSLRVFEGADHSFKTLKKSGISQEEMIDKLALATKRFALK
ncbi:MAG: alpha/beta family hydrolase [Bacteroidota bacterium]